MATRRETTDSVLVGIVPRAADLAILLEQGWYRVPVGQVPKLRGWPQKWFAAFEPKRVSGGIQLVRYYGKVRRVDEVGAEELFPGLPPGIRTGLRYARLGITGVRQLDQPIVATRNRRNPFIPTTWAKFSRARTFNDLFNGSRLEDALWTGLKRLEIEHAIEREYEYWARQRRYYLDFALFCQSGNIDVEVDGDTFHLREDRVKYDKSRNRELVERGWDVLRFSPEDIRDLDACLAQIVETIAQNGGVEGTGIAPSLAPTLPNNAQGRLLLVAMPPFTQLPPPGDHRAVAVYPTAFDVLIEGVKMREQESIAGVFGEAASSPGRDRRVSDTGRWTGRQWDANSPAYRGIVAFADPGREGTLMVTPAARHGHVRLDLQFADPGRGYTSIAAVVREGWLRDVAMLDRGEWSCGRLVDALLEVASLPNQRTVRVERGRLSA